MPFNDCSGGTVRYRDGFRRKRLLTFRAEVALEGQIFTLEDARAPGNVTAFICPLCEVRTVEMLYVGHTRADSVCVDCYDDLMAAFFELLGTHLLNTLYDLAEMRFELVASTPLWALPARAPSHRLEAEIRPRFNSD